MNKILFPFIVILLTCFFASCGSDNNDEKEDSGFSVIIGDDGKASNGGVFVYIDEKNFFLDYIKYSVEEGHLFVSGYDKTGFNGIANIPARIICKGNTYEVLRINAGVFQFCSALKSITLPNGLIFIGDGAFAQCSNLTSVIIPNSVKKIGNAVFTGCENLNSVTLSNSITEICTELFRECSSLTSVNIPSSVTSIGSSAFLECRSLSSVTIPNGVISIGRGAFSNCI